MHVGARSVALVLLVSSTAHAGGMPRIIADEYVLLGLSIGYLNDGDHGGVYGFEVSWVHSGQDVTFYGLYADVRFDSLNEGAMISVGAEWFGYIFGIEGGLVLRTGRGGHGFGARVRGCVGLAVVSVCGGGGIESLGGLFGELSVLVKAPIEID